MAAEGAGPSNEGAAKLEHVPDPGKKTTPEKRVRSLLHRLGYRFRLHARIRVTFSSSNEEKGGVRSRIPRSVSVDIVLPKDKTASLH